MGGVYLINNRPLVSVITVTKNAEFFITRTLDSLNRQIFRNFEHIVIDGISEDNTLSIIKDLGCKNTIIVSEPDKGIYEAMNKGLRLSKGTFFCFLNAGDTYDAEMLLRISESLNLDPDSDIISTDARIVQVNGEIRAQSSDPEIIRNNMVPHLGLFIRRRLGEVQEFDINLVVAADYEFLLKEISRGAKITRVPETLATFYDGGFSNKPENRIRSILETQKLRSRFGYISWQQANLNAFQYILVTIFNGPSRKEMMKFLLHYFLLDKYLKND